MLALKRAVVVSTVSNSILCLSSGDEHNLVQIFQLYNLNIYMVRTLSELNAVYMYSPIRASLFDGLEMFNKGSGLYCVLILCTMGATHVLKALSGLCFLRIFFYKSSFASKLSWKERSSLYCVQTSSLLWALSSRPMGNPSLLPIFSGFFCFGRITPRLHYFHPVIHDKSNLKLTTYFHL